MIGCDIDNCLASMVILVDTREQPSERAAKRYKTFGRPYRRQKLDFGDYSAEFTLPDGSVERLNSAIERKMDLDELEGCLTHDRARFRREFERASEAGASVYLMVESATWEKLIHGRYKTKMDPKAFTASVLSWIARFNLIPIFCQEEISGRLISEILYRELRVRLERGDYG